MAINSKTNINRRVQILILAVIIAAGNDETIIVNTFKSISWVDDIIVVVSEDSTDGTKWLAKLYTSRVFVSPNHLGMQRNYGVKKSFHKWILIQDTDEQIIDSLRVEIENAIQLRGYSGFNIPYDNHFLGHQIKNGGQSYSKTRLFRKDKVRIENLLIHPEIKLSGKIGKLKNPILHYSFRSVPQTLKKFTRYARIEAGMKYEKGERVSLKKLTLYPAHMFWSMFVEDHCYKDGIWGFGLTLCFAYMEFMRYFFLLQKQIF